MRVSRQELRILKLAIDDAMPRFTLTEGIIDRLCAKGLMHQRGEGYWATDLGRSVLLRADNRLN